jgi:predicted O-linked N-acetylglucosamine transferase (SPINDLY family)
MESRIRDPAVSRIQRLIEAGDHEGAAALASERLGANASDPAALSAMGLIRLTRGDLREAVEYLRRAVRVAPNVSSHWGNLGCAYLMAKDGRRAVRFLRHARKLADGRSFAAEYALACYLRAVHLRNAGKSGAAIRMFLAGLREQPEAAAWSDLGATYSSLGRPRAAERCFKRAIALDPTTTCFRSNLAASLLYLTDLSPDELASRHRELFAGLSWPARPPKPKSAPRPLRIGYVSADFRLRPLAFFLPPILRFSDRREFVTVCYSNTQIEDEYTAMIRSLANGWQDIRHVNDAKAAEAVRRDEIDILVDCTGHFEHGRPGLFALKPAPVQMALLGYPATSGVPGIAYRITDSLADPPGTEHLHSEEIVRLPGCYACYAPPERTPEVGPLPLSRNGFVTFGCVQKREKITPRMLEIWAAILEAEPQSMLTFHLVSPGREVAVEVRAPIERFLKRRGIASERLRWIGGLPYDDYLRGITEIDIALDTYPFNGMTTTAECLWMGVPVVTKAGTAHLSRVGLSFLNSIGMGGCVADSDDAYVHTAIRLASDLPALWEFRRGLRDRMQRSTLMDGRSYAAHIESAFRDIWRRSAGGRSL